MYGLGDHFSLFNPNTLFVEGSDNQSIRIGVTLICTFLAIGSLVIFFRNLDEDGNNHTRTIFGCTAFFSLIGMVVSAYNTFAGRQRGDEHQPLLANHEAPAHPVAQEENANNNAAVVINVDVAGVEAMYTALAELQQNGPQRSFGHGSA